MRRWFFSIVVVLISSLLSFVLLEGGIRSFRLIPDNVPVHYRHVEGDEDFAPLPNQSETSVLGVLHRTNSLGLRGPDHDSADTRPRIALLGDSVVWGFGVDESETIGARLEELSRKEGRPIVVWNLGVQANNTFNEAARYERLVGVSSPDVTVLVCLFNDLGSEATHFRITSRGTLSNPARRPPFPDSWRPFLERIAVYHAAIRAYGRLEERHEGPEYSLENMPWMLSQVARIHGTAVASGSRLVVVSMPGLWPPALEYEAFARSLSLHCSRNHIEFVDLREPLGNPPQPRFFLPSDSGHPNGEGTLRIAQALIPLVVSSIPNETQAE